ncbi:hypothetical protein WH87_00535 [Devosia epidermidihirudinis]|uniref:Bacterial sugar transferase domain-containing protein n=2 Tax=Devosia epidermidihirudinis TaxID=1293439 RepID=A0A0F5QL69_9HYPH|nr:hypothetical protein WH87_00535 [Devosia epidermidihirudinis]
MPMPPRLGASGRYFEALKRSMDIVLSTATLVGLFPALVIIASTVAFTSTGPIFFRQPREGLNGKLFTIYKFRSLYVDRSDLSGLSQAVDGDPRVTPVGRWLRQTSLDELPQLLNVLKGEMSLIGPRPHVPNMLAAGMRYDELVPYYDLRLSVRPGLSGWAQVNDLRGPTTDAERAKSRVDHDLAYVQNMSFGLDLKILWRTVSDEILPLGMH